MELLKIVFDGLVALGTLALAGVTVWLILDARQARKEERLERQRTAFRAALVEQVENCRLWYSHPYNRRGAGELLPLQGWTPSFESLNRLFGSVDLPGDLVAYLIWLMAEALEANKRSQQKLELILQGVAQGTRDSRSEPGIIADDWEVELDRLQTIACLLTTEAARRGFADVADAFRHDAPWLPWLKPTPWSKDRNRVMMAQMGDQAFRFAPPWPQAPSYAPCSPAARDQYASLIAGESKAAFYQLANGDAQSRLGHTV